VKRFILDTDSLSLFERGHPAMVQRVRSHPIAELAISVITVEEQLTGWYTEIRRAKQPARLAAMYERLVRTVEILSQFPILSFTEAAIQRFEDLRSQRLNIGAMDLRIAAIALEEPETTLVSRNLRDFQRVPGLRVEDWSV
jgi:tRNA(fMet)-specific endonuclease VapC